MRDKLKYVSRNRGLNSGLNSSPQSCSGAVLIVSMVMLLMITAMGLSGAMSAKLETIMSRNMLQKQISFNNAESAATLGEEEWDGRIVSCLSKLTDCDNEILADLAPAQLEVSNGVPDLNQIDWDAIQAQSGPNMYGLYNIEFLSELGIPGDQQRKLYIYRITARAVDSSGTSESLVQTLYRRCLKKDGYPCPS